MMIFFRVFIFLIILLFMGCGPGDYRMNQQIEMGPFVYKVSGTSEGFGYLNTGERYKKIYVDLWLDTEKIAETKIRFDDFMNGKSKNNRMIIFPAMKIVDKSGVRFDGDVKRVSRNTKWRAEFWLIIHRRGIKSRLDYIDRAASDFNLVIKNPDRRKGQPSVVDIKLS